MNVTHDAMVVRVAVLDDFEALLALERSIPEAAHWPPEEYAAMLHPAPTHANPAANAEKYVERHVLVAESHGALAGYAVGKLLHAGGEKLAEIENIAVAAAWRRRGVGQALCEGVIAWCRAQGADVVELEVRAGNVAGIGMYERLGFLATGMRRQYYHDPVEDALLMTLRRR